MKYIYVRVFSFVLATYLLGSCDNKYDLEKEINTDITIGGEYLSIPLGSTENIVLSELLDLKDDDAIQELLNGNYAISYNDEITVDAIKIDPVSLSEIAPELTPFQINLQEASVQDIVIEEVMQNNTFGINNTDVSIPPTRITLEKELSVPAVPTTGAITVRSGVISSSTNISFDISLDPNIRSIETIYLGTNGQGDIFSLELDASQISSQLNAATGYLDGLSMTFPVGTTLEAIGGEGVVSGNQYTVSRKPLVNGKATIRVLVKRIKPNGGSVSFEIDNVIISGNSATALHAARITVNANNVLNYGNADIITNDISADVAAMTFNTSFAIDNLENISHVSSVDFETGSSIKLQITRPNLPQGMQITRCDNLNIKFPAELIFQPGIAKFDYSTNTLELTAATLFTAQELPIKQLIVDKDVVNNSLSLVQNIDISNGSFIIGSVAINTQNLQNNNTITYQAGLKESTLIVSNADITISGLSADLGTQHATFEVNEPLPDEIVSLAAAEFTTTPSGKYPTIDLQLIFSGIPQAIPFVHFDNLRINFPSILQFKEDPELTDNTFISNAQIQRAGNGTYVFSKQLEVTGISLGEENDYIKTIDGKKHLVLDESITISGALKIPGANISTEELIDLSGTPSALINEMIVSVVSGIFDPAIEPITESLKLDDLPEFLQGENVNLDLLHPVIKLEAGNTFGLPVVADATITPIIKNVPQTDNQIKVSLNVASASVDGVPLWSRFWLSDTNEGMPQGFQYINKNIVPLIKKIPDAIDINMDVKAAQNGSLHTISLNQEYKMDVKYDINIPLTLGETFSIEYVDTVQKLGDEIRDITDKITSLELSLNAESTVPMALFFEMTATDEDMKKIDGLLVKIDGTIAAASRDEQSTTGTRAVVSPIKITITETRKGALKELDKLLIVVKGNATTASVGASLNKNQHLKLDMKARVPGGITINMEE